MTFYENIDIIENKLKLGPILVDCREVLLWLWDVSQILKGKDIYIYLIGLDISQFWETDVNYQHKINITFFFSVYFPRFFSFVEITFFF